MFLFPQFFIPIKINTFAPIKEKMKSYLKSTTFLAIFACLLWSTAFASLKIGLLYQTPLQFAGIRFFISGILIMLVLNNSHTFLSELKQNWKFILLLGVVQIFAQYALLYSGINLVPGALGAMIVGSSPLFIAIVSHFSFHNDKMTRLKTLSIVIGVAGIAVITLGRQKVELKNELELLGIFLLLANNIISGYSNVIISKRSGGISPLVLSSATLIIGGLLLFLASIPFEGLKTGPFPPAYYYSLTWLSLLSAVAITIWYTLLKRPGVKVSTLNTWKFLIPVSGAILSWVIIENEKPDVISIAGMAVIAVSLALLNYANRRAAKKSLQNSLPKPPGCPSCI